MALFVHDQLTTASAHQVAQLASATPTSSSRPTHAKVSQPRRFIQGAAKVLTAPFRALIQSHSPWVAQGLTTALALLAYGFGLGYLIRYSHALP